ncbi:ATP-dependent nuclease [Halodesulfovibrio spirochaetisodalis]|uniref:Uncharacterized protein n=1 Tax=Halodesulfovibrio spirochaetisodalis TaxID=1560234 RepID=A0A1B7XI53_9BACT|nr:AAA family ATPase [Halodesulfovibrio spirochaetisodalis]OBQ55193.1 hypothetical protein SP90_04290 [Halodesulfovibrio spirochaetisodalis]
MYLAKLSLWDFRKFGHNGNKPGVSVVFNECLNVLIGENDSGKTAIIDAIRLVLGTHSREWFSVEDDDFHVKGGVRSDEIKIECVFQGFTTKEASNFLEWVDIQELEDGPEYSLTVRLKIKRADGRFIKELKAGADSDGSSLPTDALELLKVIYLKPLRDADSELTSGRRSRLAQILKAHPVFIKKDDSAHPIEDIVKGANEKIKTYFHDDENYPEATKLVGTINKYLNEFFSKKDQHSADISISGSELHEILHRLSLVYDGEKAGLGSQNLLYIAAELLLAQSTLQHGLQLSLIEELEAHLHPQAQLRLINYLEEHSTGQLILTTHSTTLACSIKLENLIICKDGKLYPMGADYTGLDRKNYDFLERFLDATKANLFFAKGVILVEGDAENLLLPTIARIIGYPLHHYGVSVVNVGSTGFLHYAKIFERKNGTNMGIPVSVVTDLDIKPLSVANEEKEKDKLTANDIQKLKKNKYNSLVDHYTFAQVKPFIAPNWTLEYEIALAKDFYKSFVRSLLRAKKIGTSKYGILRQDSEERLKKEIKELLKVVEDLSSEEAAKLIYNDTMLTQNISKAITAQVFARALDQRYSKHPRMVREKLTSCDELSYLVDAISYATGQNIENGS